MSQLNKTRTKLAEMRWMPHRGLPRIVSPVFTPDSYKEAIFDKLATMKPNETIEFLTVTGSVAFTGTVKTITSVLSHVNKVMERADMSRLSREERNRLEWATPWDFFKSKEVQAIIEKIMK